MNLPAEKHQTAIDKLRVRFGERLSTSTGVRDHHSKDESWHHPHRPDAVVLLLNTGRATALLTGDIENRIPAPDSDVIVVNGGMQGLFGAFQVTLGSVH